MRRSKLCGFLGLTSLAFGISSFVFLSLVDRFYIGVFVLPGVVFTVLFLTSGIYCAFKEIHNYMFDFPTKRIAFGQVLPFIYGIFMLSYSLYLLVHLFIDVIDWVMRPSLPFGIIIGVMWILSGVIAFVAGYIYEDEELIRRREKRKQK